MPKMTHRERVMRAVNHQKPDRVPLDVGACFTSSIAKNAYQNLIQYLGIDADTVIIRKWANVVKPDEKVLKYFDIDTRMVVPPSGENWNEYWKIFRQPDGSYMDEWGCVWKLPGSGAGNYFLSSHALSNAETAEDIYKHRWPVDSDPGRYAGLKEQARRLKEETDYAVVGIFPRPIVSQSQFVRGYDKWFLDIVLNPDLFTAMLDCIVDIDLAIGGKILDEIGKYVDCMFVHDDIATQQNLMVSPEHYRQFIKPRHKKIFDLIKSKSDAKIIYHTDGAVFDILDDLIEIGVDVLNPVQTSAVGMDPLRLSEKYGQKLAFWGAIESQEILPRGSVEDVREEVRRQINSLGRNGNYILGGCHNIQDDVPPQNVIAMFEAAKELGIYS